MAGRRAKFMDKLFFGKEKSENYAKSTLPTNRWELFWDVLKGNFGKIVLLNLLMILFCIPLILLLMYRAGLISTFGANYPYSQFFGVGYSIPFTLTGYAENISFSVNTLTLLFLPLCAFLFAIGLSGGFYVMRNIVWTEGVFVINDFWRGVKLNYKKVLIISLLYSLILYILILSINYADQSIASQNNVVLFYIIKIVAILILTLISFVALHAISLTVNYEYTLIQLIKNSFIMTFGLILTNIIFALLAILPLSLLFIQNQFVLVIAVLMGLLFSVSYAMLVWTSYSQWLYDVYFNSRIKGAKTNKGIYQKQVEENKTMELYKQQNYLRDINSKLGTLPIKPITDDELAIEDLPTSFTRSDLVKLNESKQKIYDDTIKYVEEHKNDERYRVEENPNDKKKNKQQKEIEKAKKELAKRKK